MTNDETKVVVFCKICDCYINIHFSKKAFLKNATFDGGLFSGTFLHNKPGNKEDHALLVYFDKHFNHRGTVCSNLVTAKNISSRKNKK